MSVSIAFEGVTKSYNGHKVLDGVSFSVAKGEIYGIIGSSGAGKSTLTKLITGLEKPDAGRIWVEGEEISQLDEKQLRGVRHKIGMIFQHFNLLDSKDVVGNVGFPLELQGQGRQEREKRAFELLQLVGLEQKKNEAVASLSGGQKQRVAIARALSGSPTLLLSDEATASLDPKSTRAVLDLLLQLNAQFGLTILLITHQMEVIKHLCTKMAVLEQGRIVEEGRVVDIFAAPTHPMTSHLLAYMTHDAPKGVCGAKNEEELLRLIFKGEVAGEPVISSMIRKFDIEVNILLGAIDRLQEGVLGTLTVSLSGKKEAREAAREYLLKRGVKVEAIHE